MNRKSGFWKVGLLLMMAVCMMVFSCGGDSDNENSNNGNTKKDFDIVGTYTEPADWVILYVLFA